jgi:hypothetical protein
MGLPRFSSFGSVRGRRSKHMEMPAMSALGQKQTLRRIKSMSALPPKADIPRRNLNVRFGPKADIREARPGKYRREASLQLPQASF